MLKQKMSKEEIGQVKKYTKLLSECAEHSDLKAYDKVMSMLNETIDAARKRQELADDGDTLLFGKLNSIVESSLMDSLKNNSKSIGRVIKAIKEDKNLLGQFKLIESIRSYVPSDSDVISPEKYLDAAISENLSRVNKKKVNESNGKFRDFIFKNGMVSKGPSNKADLALFEAVHALSTLECIPANLYEIERAKKQICESMMKNQTVREEKLSLDKILEGIGGNKDTEERGIKVFNELKEMASMCCDKMICDECSTSEEVSMANDIKESISNLEYDGDIKNGNVRKLLELSLLLIKPTE